MIVTETQTKLLAARMNVGLIYWCERRTDKAIAHFEELMPEFEAYGDSLLLAKLHNNLGLAHRQKGDLDRTIFEYELVKKYLNQIDDLPAIAVVESNIAFAKLTQHKYAEAHSHLNIAEEILTNFDDEALLGQMLETRARVYMAEGEMELAKEAIDRSEQLLLNGVEFGPMAETLKTKELIEAQMRCARVGAG